MLMKSEENGGISKMGKKAYERHEIQTNAMNVRFA